MAEYESEQEQLDVLKKWWKENGKGIIAGLVLGLIGVFGWRHWQARIDDHGAQASMSYNQVMNQFRDEKPDEARLTADHLIQEAADTPYPGLASLVLAKMAIEEGDLEQAVHRLRWTKENASLPEIKQAAHLRLARVLLEQGDTEQALAELSAALLPEQQASHEELRGDILVAEGQPDAAREAYQKALEIASSGADNQVLQMKLDDLGEMATVADATQ